ncbi:Crp/Fnr family transcriptional regulator [Anaerococcus sp. AGMB00486]|uniref:Crp/Fnr family transcriptional regulator n=2 Tax=Anaerococcus TaxID=165779 RepID=A0ABX2NBI1_9FIRM|nr:Crp/Fnr family transcriptional regulator [Anaerococcus faecalis]MSS78257.1 Crp/Fnr family transcriptional regulator [Anaerococcus porci]NVF12015.1 Crp/Fnr family transcriptional regulator [Anaerococcus faecalis]
MSLDYGKIDLFNFLTKKELDRLSKDVKIKEYKKGETVFSPGDKPEKMFVIYEGFIKIFMLISDGREQILYIYGKGEFVGGHNMLKNEDYIYHGLATSDVKIIELDKYDFSVLINNKIFLRRLIDQSYKRIRKSEKLIDRLIVINADMKVAKLLIDLIGIYGKIKANGTILLDTNITRQELASYAGISRETMSRKLSYLEDMGIIDLEDKGKILIKNMKELRKFTL